MQFGKVYPLLVSKAEKKGRTKEEADQIISWLTGYTAEAIEEAVQKQVTYGDFFRNAPRLNPNRKQIKGSVCGVRVEEIKEPLMREIRYLDKLVDELAKGKALERIMMKVHPLMTVRMTFRTIFLRKKYRHTSTMIRFSIQTASSWKNPSLA